MDNNKNSILFEFEEKKSNIIDSNRRIPTQCKYYNIQKDEYIIVGFKDSSIYIWALKNSEFVKIKMLEKKGDGINGICLFKNKEKKEKKELSIIFSKYEKSKINIMDFNGNEKNININIDENIYFLEILEKNNKHYIIAGLLNKVISFQFSETPTGVKNYENKNKKKLNINSNMQDIKGHKCVVIYKPKENENDIKIIDSDTEYNRINIFNFESKQLLLILDLIYCKPLGINVWDEKHIIVSCLESNDNNLIKIIKINLDKKLYNQEKIDLLKNEDKAEGKILCGLKGHEKGTFSTLNMKNIRYGEFFVSIGKNQDEYHSLKLWINDIGASSFEISSK